MIDKNESVDLIFKDLLPTRLNLLSQILSLNALLNAKDQIAISDSKKNITFIYPDEVKNILNRKLKKAKKKLELVNYEIAQIPNFKK